jgi:chromate transport protein ChrA
MFGFFWFIYLFFLFLLLRWRKPAHVLMWILSCNICIMAFLCIFTLTRGENMEKKNKKIKIITFLYNNFQFSIFFVFCFLFLFLFIINYVYIYIYIYQRHIIEDTWSDCGRARLYISITQVFLICYLLEAISPTKQYHPPRSFPKLRGFSW